MAEEVQKLFGDSLPGPASERLMTRAVKVEKRKQNIASPKRIQRPVGYDYPELATEIESRDDQNQAAEELRKNKTLDMLNTFGFVFKNQEKEKKKQAQTEGKKQSERAYKRVENLGSTKGRIKESAKIGLEARGAISEKRFTGEIFIVTLLLSLFKDFSDVLDLGTLGTVINLPVTIALFITFWGLGNRIRKLVIRRFIGAIILETIPFLNIVPVYTILTLWMRIKSDSDEEKAKRQEEEKERQTKNQRDNIENEK